MADIPPGLKPVSPFIAISRQFAKRDPVISYYCLMYTVQQGIRLGKKDEAAKAYLMKLMDQLQVKKAELKDEDALKDEEIAQAHIEESALKMFDAADKNDRAAQYNVNVVRTFLMAGRLFTILTQFGEVSEEISDKTKYAKYKATDINRCLNSGVTPTPGPPGGWGQANEQEEEDQSGEGVQPPPPYGFSMGPPPPDTRGQPPYPGAQPVLPPPRDDTQFIPTPAPRRNIPSPNSSPVTQPRSQPPSAASSYNPPPPPTTSPAPSQGVANISVNEIAKVQKYCKYAVSSLDYDDRVAAIDYLEKSLRILRTGKE